jgi:hypothetical protein
METFANIDSFFCTGQTVPVRSWIPTTTTTTTTSGQIFDGTFSIKVSVQ